MNPASQCDFASFKFDGQGSNFGFSVLTANGSNLQNRWSVTGTEWTRTVRTAGLTRLTGAVTGLDATGPVKVGWGCVNPSIQITRPTTASYQPVGLPTAPRRFITQVKVTGPGGEAIAGLTPEAFNVSRHAPGRPRRSPRPSCRARSCRTPTGCSCRRRTARRVRRRASSTTSPSASAAPPPTQNDALLYVERATDTMIVLDRSGSMADANKIAAARNGATLLDQRARRLRPGRLRLLRHQRDRQPQPATR